MNGRPAPPDSTLAEDGSAHVSRIFLKDCSPGDVIDNVFVVTGKQLSATTSGKPFIKAFVADRSCQVTARMWNASRDAFNAMPESGLLRIRGRIENYQGNLQFIIETIGPAMEGSYDIADLVPHTPKDIDQMCQRVFEICGSIQNRHLAALVQAFLDDEDLMNNFAKAPAATTFHHAYIGGLLEHTLNAMEVADAIVRFYPGLNRDLVLAGIFLHDIAKTWELNYDTAFNYSDGGQLVGHIVKSAIWIEAKAQHAAEVLGEPIPAALVNTMQHIVLAHHGSYEFGSARVPATPEALAVHMIENMDAKLMMALTATRGLPGEGAEGNWTEYMKPFSGRLYRPDVAPAEADAEPEPTPRPAPVTARLGSPQLRTSNRPARPSHQPPAHPRPANGQSAAPPAHNGPSHPAPMAPADPAPVNPTPATDSPEHPAPPEAPQTPAPQRPANGGQPPRLNNPHFNIAKRK